MASFPRSLPQPVLPRLRGGPVLRWGIMAPGAIARRFAGAVLKHTDQRIVAVGSRSAERAEEFARDLGIGSAYGSYEQLATDPDVDAVYIAAPHSEHLRLGLLAIEAGKHVLVEKPVTVTAEQARVLREAAAAAGVYLVEAMHTRFNPRTSILEQLLADGVLGELSGAYADLGFAGSPDPAGRMHNPDLAGGALLDLGVYAVWFTTFVLGRPAGVTATGSLTATGVDARSAVAGTSAEGALWLATTDLTVFTPSFASVHGSAGRVLWPSRLPGIGPLELFDATNELRLRYDDLTGIPALEGLCRQAAVMAEEIAEGRTTSARHPLEVSIDVLTTIDEARAQLGVRYPASVEAATR